MSWSELRIRILAVTFCSAILILGKIILFPIVDKDKFTAFDFPQQVPLPQWELNTTRPLSKLVDETDSFNKLWNYQYTQKGIQSEQSLNIDIHYLVTNKGFIDVPKSIKGFYKTSSSPTQRYQEGVGYYGVGIDERQKIAYLSSCINPRGGSTFTMIQFIKNRYLHDVSPDRLLHSTLGQDPLFDKRCLWTHLSIPLKNSSPETAYKVLENVWFDWYRWWKMNYPKP